MREQVAFASDFCIYIPIISNTYIMHVSAGLAKLVALSDGTGVLPILISQTLVIHNNVDGWSHYHLSSVQRIGLELYL